MPLWPLSVVLASANYAFARASALIKSGLEKGLIIAIMFYPSIVLRTLTVQNRWKFTLVKSIHGFFSQMTFIYFF